MVFRNTIMKFFRIKKTKLRYQIEEYIVWKSRMALLPESKQRDLHQLDKVSKKSDIKDVTHEDLELYREFLLKEYNGHFAIISGMKEIRCMLRYFHSRKYECLPPDTISNEGFILINESTEDIIENMKEIIADKKEKNKGGRGKVEIVRNTAIATLRKVDSDMFTTYSLGKLFDLSAKRISQISKETPTAI